MHPAIPARTGIHSHTHNLTHNITHNLTHNITHNLTPSKMEPGGDGDCR